MEDKTAYLKQAVAYQVADLRIGFLVALRHKVFDSTGPPPHLSSLIGHTTFEIENDSVPDASSPSRFREVAPGRRR